MSDSQGRGRPVVRPRTGAKICVLIAALFVVAGVYTLFVPINLPNANGVFGCGSALRPPSDPFAVGVCKDLSTIQQMRVAALGAAALVVAGLGFVLFGVEKVARPARAGVAEPDGS